MSQPAMSQTFDTAVSTEPSRAVPTTPAKPARRRILILDDAAYQRVLESVGNGQVDTVLEGPPLTDGGEGNFHSWPW